MYQQTTSFIGLVILLMTVFELAHTQQFILGENKDYKFAMTYVQREGGEALRVKYQVNTPGVILPGRAHMSICWTTPQPPPGTVEEEPIDETPSNEPAQVDPAPTNSVSEPALQESKATVGVPTPSNGGRNLATELGKCFAIKFECYLKVSCLNSLDAAISLYSSSIIEGTNIFAAGGADLYLGNVGSIAIGSAKEYNTVFRFNDKDAPKTNLPLVGETTHMTCYSAFNITIPESVLFNEHDLSDTKKFTKKKNILFGVSDQSIKDAAKSNPEAAGQETSGAFLNVLNLSILSVLLAIFTIF